MSDRDATLAILEAHRLRVADAANFQEFQEAQLDLLDWMIADKKARLKSDEANKDFQAKWEDWSNK